MKIGLEVEFFGKSNSTGLIVSMSDAKIPHDEYPLLAEARGLPFNCVFQAIGSVRAEIEKIISLMKGEDISPLFVDWLPRDKHTDKLHEEILRNGLTKHIAYRNLDNKEISKKNKKNISAGLHISFTIPHDFDYTDKKNVRRTYTHNQLFDFPFLFRKLEKEFGTEIKDSGRIPGFYEIKPDGRIEYRSLPATLIHKTDFASRLHKCLD